jgi:CRP-like cAMP-binding protein
MTVTDSPPDAAPAAPEQDGPQLSLSTAAARNLATTTKTAPQMQGISSRWLLRMLPWVEASGGTYRVNRRLTLRTGRGRVGFVQAGADDVRIIPETLREIPVLRGFGDTALLASLAGRFAPRDVRAGQVLAEAGQPVTDVFVLAHGKVELLGRGKYGATAVLGVRADGDHLGDEALDQAEPRWEHTVRAATAGVVMVLPWAGFLELYEGSPALREHVAAHVQAREAAADDHGEAAIALAAGHEGEAELPGTFVDYELAPREYELSAAQTILRVHSRVADLYNHPMSQIEQQLRLTVHALRERQEWELVNNRSFGLLHNTGYDQRISTRTGPPTPDDLDELLSMRRDTTFLLAHPKAIAAFFRECTKRGVYPDPADLGGRPVLGWRGVPLLPCGKIPVVGGHTSSIFAMRTGEDDQGVVGLRQTGIPDEYEPGLNVRFMGIDEKAIIRYLVSTYYSVAILVPDAIGILENAEVAARQPAEPASVGAPQGPPGERP